MTMSLILFRHLWRRNKGDFCKGKGLCLGKSVFLPLLEKGSTNGVMNSARKGAMNENPPATEGDIFGSLRTCEG